MRHVQVTPQNVHHSRHHENGQRLAGNVAKSDKWLLVLPENGRMAGCRVRKRDVGDHVEAGVKTIRETTKGLVLSGPQPFLPPVGLPR